jgi:hypothetical protein
MLSKKVVNPGFEPRYLALGPYLITLYIVSYAGHSAHGREYNRELVVRLLSRSHWWSFLLWVF